MSDCINTITSQYDKLTPSERKVADYMVGHLSDAIRLNVNECSRAADVSVATTVRFTKRLGFDGYRDFCIRMAQNMNTQVDYVLDIKKDDGGLEQRISDVLMASVETLRTTLDLIDYDKIKQAAEQIIKCRNLLFIGLGTSNIVCQDAMLRFLRAGKQASCYSDPHANIVAITHFDQRDVVVGISHSGVTKEVVQSMKLAKQNGVQTIGITTYPDQPIGQYSDIILPTMSRESPMHKVALTSRTSQLAIIDALFIAVLMQDYDHTMTGVLEVSDNIRNEHYKTFEDVKKV